MSLDKLITLQIPSHEFDNYIDSTWETALTSSFIPLVIDTYINHRRIDANEKQSFHVNEADFRVKEAVMSSH